MPSACAEAADTFPVSVAFLEISFDTNNARLVMSSHPSFAYASSRPKREPLTSPSLSGNSR